MEPAGAKQQMRPDPIRRSKLHELVSGKLEAKIRSGELKPGDLLPSERDLMVTFDIGRPAVREALLSLQTKGLIVTENGRRASVRTPNVDSVFTALDSVVGVVIESGDSLKHLFDARLFIEAAMARNAANKITESQLADLKAALAANKQAIGSRDLFMETDIAFHRILFLVSGNPVFEAVHKALVNWLMARWRQIERSDATETLAFKGHQKIYLAVAKRDPDAAEAAMQKHLASSWAIWSAQLHKPRE